MFIASGVSLLQVYFCLILGLLQLLKHVSRQGLICSAPHLRQVIRQRSQTKIPHCQLADLR